MLGDLPDKLRKYKFVGLIAVYDGDTLFPVLKMSNFFVPVFVKLAVKSEHWFARFEQPRRFDFRRFDFRLCGRLEVAIFVFERDKFLSERHTTCITPGAFMP